VRVPFLGIEVTRTKQVVPTLPAGGAYGGIGRGGWWPIVREPFSGAWQRNMEVRVDTMLSYHAVFACVTRIAQDIGKLRIKLVEQDANGIWNETTSPAFSPVLKKPNSYQTRIKFLEQWITSKLIHGNTYVLKERDARGVVTDLYVLHPQRVKPLVAPDGSVYYQLGADVLSGVAEDRPTVPASEIIHDTMVALYHPLVGVSPIYACGLAASQGLNIQRQSAEFFENGSKPGGVLTAPGRIDKETAERIKAHWEANYTGPDAGRVAVLGDGLAYQAMVMTAVDAQLIEQLKWTAETICSCFHVPSYMVGVTPPPSHANIDALNQQYYAQCVQSLIESLELCLDEGLGLVNVPGHTYGTELDLDGLLRMDAAAQYKTYGDGIQAGLLAPNEGRRKLDLAPLPGGDTAYLQQQNFSLSALSKRDALADPFGVTPAAKSPAIAAPAANSNDRAAAIWRSWKKAMPSG
jgi:HK97 family phage portal protein